MSAINAVAAGFRQLHISGKPVVLANVYDLLSARTIAQLPSCKALATASFAVAKSNGVEDEELTLERNLAAAKTIAEVAKQFGKPLTVDCQDGYGEQLEETVSGIIGLGAVGMNLEDCDRATHTMLPFETSVSRVKRAVDAAKKNGVDSFVVNARCDILARGGEITDAIERGKAYLQAGATTVFVLPSSKGFSRDQIASLVEALEGRVNIGLSMAPGKLTVNDLAELGVARISVGPQIQFKAVAAMEKEADAILKAAL